MWELASVAIALPDYAIRREKSCKVRRPAKFGTIGPPLRRAIRCRKVRLAEKPCPHWPSIWRSPGGDHNFSCARPADNKAGPGNDAPPEPRAAWPDHVQRPKPRAQVDSIERGLCPTENGRRDSSAAIRRHEARVPLTPRVCFAALMRRSSRNRLRRGRYPAPAPCERRIRLV